jgi:hypothetical protein
VAQVGEVGDLTRWDLELPLSERGEQIDALDIETRGEKLDAARLAVGNELAVHLFAELESAEHRMLGFAAARRLALVVRLWSCACGKPVCSEGLKLHHVCAGSGGDIDQAAREIEVAVMIHARFGNDERLHVRRSPMRGVG